MGHLARCEESVREHAEGLRVRVERREINASAIEGLLRSFIDQPAYDVTHRPRLIELGLAIATPSPESVMPDNPTGKPRLENPTPKDVITQAALKWILEDGPNGEAALVPLIMEALTAANYTIEPGWRSYEDWNNDDSADRHEPGALISDEVTAIGAVDGEGRLVRILKLPPPPGETE